MNNLYGKKCFVDRLQNMLIPICIQESGKSSEPNEKKPRSWEKGVGTLSKVSLGSLVKKKTAPNVDKGRGTSAEHVVVGANSNGTATVPKAGGLTLVGNYSSGDSSDET